MKKNSFIFMGLLTLLFVCCSGTLKIITYVSDLIAVASMTEDVMYVTANIVVENLKDEADINFLRQRLNSFSNEQIVKYNYSDSLSFDIKIPIINERKISTYNLAEDLVYIISSEKNGTYIFSYKFNENLMRIIDKYVYSSHYQHIDFNDFDISIVIDNDMRNTINFIAYSVYVNGNPYPFEYIGKIQRRDRIELQISEVLRSAVIKNQNNTYQLFKINK
jgi:hypothetical protein